MPGEVARCVPRVLSSAWAARDRGGTGRRAGLRILWGNPWGFESLRSHRQHLTTLRAARRERPVWCPPPASAAYAAIVLQRSAPSHRRAICLTSLPTPRAAEDATPPWIRRYTPPQGRIDRPRVQPRGGGRGQGWLVVRLLQSWPAGGCTTTDGFEEYRWLTSAQREHAAWESRTVGRLRRGRMEPRRIGSRKQCAAARRAVLDGGRKAAMAQQPDHTPILA